MHLLADDKAYEQQLKQVLWSDEIRDRSSANDKKILTNKNEEYTIDMTAEDVAKLTYRDVRKVAKALGIRQKEW